MGLYLYQHPKTGKIVEVVQKMLDKHVFVDDSGVEWKRVFTIPNSAIDSHIDPFSLESFKRSTEKKISYGELMDESKVLSEKREKVFGYDPLKKKTFDDYKKKTGKPHPFSRPKKIENKNLTLDL